MKPLLLVDGYNVIGAWSVPREEHLSIEQARERLVHLIADYAGYSGEEVIVVFDGHYTDRPTRSRTMMHGVEVVFTKHAESADNYIEAACAEMAAGSRGDQRRGRTDGDARARRGAHLLKGVFDRNYADPTDRTGAHAGGKGLPRRHLFPAAAPSARNL